MAKAAFNNNRAFFTGKMELRKKLVKCYIWSIVLSSSSFISVTTHCGF
jgi:hypothetical protein